MSTEKRMGCGWIIAIILGVTFLWLYGHGMGEQEQEVQTQTRVQDPNNKVIAFDWANDREITQRMADTMVRIGSDWYTDTEFREMSRTTRKPKTKKTKWIKPAGRKSSYNKDPDKVQIWEEQQRLEQQQEQAITEDDVRDIINEDNH